MRSPIKLLVIDFDGTALGGHEPYAQFPADFARFLDGLKARGVQWATNTTWGVEGQWELIQRSGLKSRPAFLCGGTGQFLARVVRGRPVHDQTFERAVVRKHRVFRRRHGARVRSVLGQILDANLAARLSVDFDNENIVSFHAAPGCAGRLMKRVAPLLRADAYYLWHPERQTTNTLMPVHINKGGVIAELHARMGIGPENTVVAGDASNDLAMFDRSVAHYAICPANAEPVIKKRVRQLGGYIARRDFSWGVIEGVEHWLAPGARPAR